MSRMIIARVIIRRILFSGLFMVVCFCLRAQNPDYPFPSLSPKGIVTQVVGNTLITIEYERPSARGRKIFGQLVPWNKVWRTGAGSCTKISFDKDVIVGGQKVKAGKYALLSIPNPEEWVIILNKDTTLYSGYNYSEEKDEARFIVFPNVSDRFYEALNFDIELEPNDARIYISWVDVQLDFKVETQTDSDLEELIRTELLTRKSKNWETYAGASEHLLYQGRQYSDALKLADYAIELEDHGWPRNLKVKIYERLKLYDEAISELHGLIEFTNLASYDSEETRTNIIKEIELDLEKIKRLK